MSERILGIIRECLAEVTEHAIGEVTADMRLDTDFDLDSIMFVHFLLSLEDRFPDLRFDPEVIGETSFNDIGELTIFLSRLTPAAA